MLIIDMDWIDDNMDSIIRTPKEEARVCVRIGRVQRLWLSICIDTINGECRRK